MPFDQAADFSAALLQLEGQAKPFVPNAKIDKSLGCVP